LQDDAINLQEKKVNIFSVLFATSIHGNEIVLSHMNIHTHKLTHSHTCIYRSYT
jgi:hypothetical protein